MKKSFITQKTPTKAVSHRKITRIYSDSCTVHVQQIWRNIVLALFKALKMSEILSAHHFPRKKTSNCHWIWNEKSMHINLWLSLSVLFVHYVLLSVGNYRGEFSQHSELFLLFLSLFLQLTSTRHWKMTLRISMPIQNKHRMQILKDLWTNRKTDLMSKYMNVYG